MAAKTTLPFYQKSLKRYDHKYRSKELGSIMRKYLSESTESASCFDSIQHEETSAEVSEVSKRRGTDLNALRWRLLESDDYQDKKRREQVPRLPEFLIKPRSRVVWEKSNAKFTCTLQGFPEPRVRWYKNSTQINVHEIPGKYRIDSFHCVHTLEINRCDANDSAQYRVFATNIEGKVSVFATLVVKSFRGQFDEMCFYSGVPTQTAQFTDLLVPGIDDNQNVISIRDKFGVSFGTEGETLTLSCTVFTYPKEKHGFPIIQWWQDDQQLCESELVQTYWDGERATLVLACLNKDAEGLYTIRVAIPAGQAEHRAHVFVRDAPSSSPGVPPAPLHIHAERTACDSVMLTWCPPSLVEVGDLLGYIIERCEEGSRDWLPCNSVPIVVARFPLMGLLPGCSYQFRVRAVGTAGTGRASQPTQPLVVLDPRCDLQGEASAPYTGQITVTEEEPSDATVPGPPRELRVSESTRSFIILRWTPPTSQSLLTTSEAVTYYVEKSEANKDSWERLNGDNPIRGLQYAVLDVPEGKSFHFRVLACNSAGEGPASKACGPVSLTDWLPAPSAPENVQASRCSDSSVQLSWEASESRQGLLGYYIECRVVGETDWNSCHNKPITNTRFEVYGLKKGQEYEFRVHAVNATGFSNYSGTTEPIIVQAAIGFNSMSPAWPLGASMTHASHTPLCDEQHALLEAGPQENELLEENLLWISGVQGRNSNNELKVSPCDSKTEDAQKVLRLEDNTLISLVSKYDCIEESSFPGLMQEMGPRGEADQVLARKEHTVVLVEDPAKEANVDEGFKEEAVLSDSASHIVTIPEKGAAEKMLLDSCSQDHSAHQIVKIKDLAQLGTNFKQEQKHDKNDTDNLKHEEQTDILSESNVYVKAEVTVRRQANEIDCENEGPTESEAITEIANVESSMNVQDHLGIPLKKDNESSGSSKPCKVEQKEIISSQMMKDMKEGDDASRTKTYKGNGKSASDTKEKLNGSKMQKRDKRTKGAVQMYEEENSTPSPPRDVVVLSCTRHSMVLGWKEPAKTGGCAITRYHVDSYSEDGSLETCFSTKGPERLLEVTGLKEGAQYKFCVSAENLVGIGKPSKESEAMNCCAWEFPEPGPCRDLRVTEIRNDSVTLSWKCPPYLGQTAISGYFLEVRLSEEGTWRRVNESETSSTFLKASGLTPHQNFVFRVHAVNSSGVGRPSLECGPVETRILEGLEEMSLQCDAVGEIFLCWKCPNTDFLERVTWSKNHEPVSESSNLFMKIDDGCTKLIFGDPSMGDLGMYECTVDGVEGISASYTITEKEMRDMLEDRKAITDPVVPLKSGLAVELQDRGRVRLWTSAEHLSSTCQARCIFNDNVISPGQKYDIRIDRNAGLVEILMDRLLPEDEGSYSVQLKDGAAESETTLVFIGEDFRRLLKESETMVMEWQREQGPHFTEPLTWEVTQECNVKLFAKVGNIKNTTSVLWFKDDKQVMVDEDHDFNYGFCSLLISQITRRDEGVFSLELKDERGREITLLDLTMTAFDKVITEVCKMSARQASELKVKSSADSVILYGLVPYYLDPLQTTWLRGNSKLPVSEGIQAGVTENKIWIQIKEPTEKDKGHYTLELQAGDEMHNKVIDFSGSVFDEAMQEHRRLKEAAFAEKNRGKVLGGLADVVTIMEGKSLNLTCVVSGEPVPEVCWLKGKQNMSSDERYLMSYDKDGYSASLIISDVKHEDTGEYHVFVRNKYGSDTVSFTVSVYLPGQELPSSLV